MTLHSALARGVAGLGLLCASMLVTACRRETAPPPPPIAEAETQRSLPAGDVIGTAGVHGGHAWLGIPFAQPPVGALRWRAPRALPRWDGVREARAFGSPCPQFANALSGVPGERGAVVGDEDCLFLNVYAPAFAPAEASA